MRAWVIVLLVLAAWAAVASIAFSLVGNFLVGGVLLLAAFSSLTGSWFARVKDENDETAD